MLSQAPIRFYVCGGEALPPGDGALQHEWVEIGPSRLQDGGGARRARTADTHAWLQARGVPYLFRNTSTRPAVSTIVCRPVKKGWQLEHTVTRMLGTVERVCTVAPQVHVISVSMDAG